MTNYEAQIARNTKYADRTTEILRTPTMLVYEIDANTPESVTYVMVYDEAGKLVSSSWQMTYGQRGHYAEWLAQWWGC